MELASNLNEREKKKQPLNLKISTVFNQKLREDGAEVCKKKKLINLNVI
jgi:hypothetical protein